MISVSDIRPSGKNTFQLVIDYKTDRMFQKLELRSDRPSISAIRDKLLYHRVQLQSDSTSIRNSQRRKSVFF